MLPQATAGWFDSMPLIAAIEFSDAVLQALPVIVSLILIEGLLSVDNALAIAAMASHLPGRQKIMALRFGIIGAYVFRGLAMAFAAWIIDNPWLKLVGALYLIYLACSHLVEEDKHNEPDTAPDAIPANRGFWPTIIGIEVMDLSLSVDNVVAAVALSPNIWVVCTGVFIGILVLRFLAGYCIQLIERFPILGKTAFLLVGFVGVLLVAEILTDYDLHTWQKFIGIVLITAGSVAYSRSSMAQRVFSPVFRGVRVPMGWFATVVETLFWPLKWFLRRSAGWLAQRSPEA